MEMTRGYVGAEARSGNDLTKQGGGCQVQLNARAGVSIASSIGGKLYEFRGCLVERSGTDQRVPRFSTE